MIPTLQPEALYENVSSYAQSNPLVPLAPLRIVHRSRLSSREKETLLYASRGFTSYKIGELLNLSRETIDTHRRNIIRKLRVNNLTEAVAFGLRNKIIE